MKKWKCTVCGYIYDESKEGIPFIELPADWTCPQCGAPKSAFVQIEGEETITGAASTVADKIVEQLAAYGVKRVYGIPGDSNLPLTESIRKNPNTELILTRHEGAAAFMASAHAKLTGEIGVCMSIAGPGATNLITGIVDAATDRAPVLALLGQVPEIFLGSESLQEIAEVDIFKSFCVYAEMIGRAGQTLKVVNLAIKKAYAAPGPVALSLPTDVLVDPLEEPIWQPESHLFKPDLFPGESIEKAARLIAESKRPLLFAGWGARHCRSELLNLARHIGAPIATTSRAKGVVPESDELVLGVLGSIGNRFAPKIVAQSDLIIILGSGFRQRNLVPEVDIIQVDIDETRVGKTFPVKLGIVGDAHHVIQMLMKTCSPKKTEPRFMEAIRAANSEYQALLEADARNKQRPIHPGAVIQALKRQVAKNALICSDVGDHTYWFYKRFVCEGQQTLLCANMAGMAFGIPAAIACQFAQPKRQVIAYTGDGGFGMAGMEFTTAVHNKLPIKVVVFNEGKLKNIKKEQEEYGYAEYRVSFPNPNFAEMAASAGGLGIRVSEPEKLDKAIRQALDSPLPALVEIMVDPNVYIKGIRRK
ncbi:MAG: thiamine pyrophosphate-binding protein [Candidatus Aminicenantes bacterium]|nr:thiamine pyrophosphate-binding protein [Candidatus Aminicenantes bacterium]